MKDVDMAIYMVDIRSLDLFVVFDDLVKLTELLFLILIKLFHDELLGVDAVADLLFKFLESCLHPVGVVLSWDYLGFF
jgi:hypothetical protein